MHSFHFASAELVNLVENYELQDLSLKRVQFYIL